MLALAARVVPVSVLEKRNRVFMNLLQHTVQRWEACPGSRKELETLLRARICDRVHGRVPAGQPAGLPTGQTQRGLWGLHCGTPARAGGLQTRTLAASARPRRSTLFA